MKTPIPEAAAMVSTRKRATNEFYIVLVSKKAA
jgi:hypothetical protein